MTPKEKDAFRKTKKWKEFRVSLLEARDYTCEICGKRSKKGMNVHHYDEEHYTNLLPSKFAVLCRFCHSSLLERKLLRTKSMNIDSFCENLKRVYLRSREH